jgi:heme-degrading monooxygenase HmoA
MVARVTLADIDTVRISIPDAVQRLRERILPPLQDQPGYRGLYAFATAEGAAMVVTFWDSDDAAEAGLRTGFYASQVEQFVTFYRSPPGRTTYDVVVEDRPGVPAS